MRRDLAINRHPHALFYFSLVSERLGSAPSVRICTPNPSDFSFTSSICKDAENKWFCLIIN